MEEFLMQVSVGEYSLFRERVLEATKWTRTQYNDRKVGRVKITPLEREVIAKIVAELPHKVVENEK